MSENKHHIDQNLAMIRDGWPRFWWAIYQGCLAVGFDPQQAFSLTQTYIISQNPNGVRPSSEFGPKQDETQ